jgi:predicted dehydrogenase
MAIKIAFIGVGGRGRGWLRRANERVDIEPVAVVDPSDVALQAVAEEFDELKLPAFSTVEEAAAEIEADAAIIAASSWTRRGNGLAALEAGWHILAEKPFALNFDDARAIVDVGKEKGLVVSAGQNYRFLPGLGTMRKMVAAGDIGTLGHGVFVRHRKRYAGQTYQKTMRHNYLWEMGVHDLDMIRFTVGLKPLRVSGYSFLPPWGDFEGETSVSAIFEFEGGVNVSYFGAWASHIPEHHWRVDGSGGSLRLAGGQIGSYRQGALGPISLKRGRPEDREWTKVEPLAEFGGDDALLDELIAAIEAGGQTSTSGEDNLWTVAMMEAIVRSTEAGGTQVDIGAMVEGK